jgi:hypothetical protein
MSNFFNRPKNAKKKKLLTMVPKATGKSFKHRNAKNNFFEHSIQKSRFLKISFELYGARFLKTGFTKKKPL